MDAEMDLVSKLMGNDPGGQNFFAPCLLFLNPEDLKACRLVNKVWDQFIMEEVWGENRVRSRRKLEVKLVERWKTAEPTTVELGQAGGRVNSMFCNDAFVFCGDQRNVRVKVYSTSGEWVRDLIPGEVGTGVEGFTKVAGSNAIAIAVTAADFPTVTVWSSHNQMEQLYHFNANNYNCLDLACQHGGGKTIEDFRVEGSKIALLVKDFGNNKTSLVVIKRGEHFWEEKTLTCFPKGPSNSSTDKLATEGNWVAVVNGFSTGPRLNSKKVMLWQNDTFRQEIDLPGCFPGAMWSVAMELPFLIISLGNVVKVFRLAADKGMDDISTVATLVKSIPFPDFWPIPKVIRNKLFFGFVQGQIATLIEKMALVDPAEETERREINLVYGHCGPSMNTTSLVWLRAQERGRGREADALLVKKDFWM